jgi:hypothetical protein
LPECSEENAEAQVNVVTELQRLVVKTRGNLPMLVVVTAMTRTRCYHMRCSFFYYKMRLETNATLKCGALRRLKMAVATGARGAVLCDAQPILDAGALTQARTGDQARREESAAETQDPGPEVVGSATIPERFHTF